MSKPGFEKLAQSSSLYPQESLAAVKSKKGSLQIGMPLEISLQESRISLTPDAVEILVSNGHEIVIETQAGVSSKFTDNEYSEAGAKIVYSPEEVYRTSV